MCKITNILPDNSATWIWNFQTLVNDCGPSLYRILQILLKYQLLIFTFDLFASTLVQLCSIENQDDPCYEVKLRVFPIAYHRLKILLRSWSLLSKKIKTGGSQKCKVHCCNFKLTSLQIWQLRDLNPGLSRESRGNHLWLTREARVQIPELPNFEDL